MGCNANIEAFKGVTQLVRMILMVRLLGSS